MKHKVFPFGLLSGAGEERIDFLGLHVQTNRSHFIPLTVKAVALLGGFSVADSEIQPSLMRTV